MRPVQFMLVVDDFGVKYVGEQHLNHLLTALRKFFVLDKNEKKRTSTAASHWTGIITRKGPFIHARLLFRSTTIIQSRV